jgi:hypothetical protein
MQNSESTADRSSPPPEEPLTSVRMLVRDPTRLLDTHVSTAERLSSLPFASTDMSLSSSLPLSPSPFPFSLPFSLSCFGYTFIPTSLAEERPNVFLLTSASSLLPVYSAPSPSLPCVTAPSSTTIVLPYVPPADTRTNTARITPTQYFP